MIEHYPSAPEGCVTTLSSYTTQSFPLGSAILCRNNAPLTAFAVALVRRSVPVKILGRNFGQGLRRIVEGRKAQQLGELAEKLQSWRKRELKRCHTPAAQHGVTDKYECLTALYANSSSVADLLSKIETLFVNEANGGCVTLATGHKAKGLEWIDVFILDRHLIPSKWSREPWELTQERNLLYVMVTRARLNLTYIESNKWRRE